MSGTDSQPPPIGIGRERQFEIYVGGARGAYPQVPVSFERLEQAARKKMSPQGYAYVAGGAGTEETIRANGLPIASYHPRAAMSDPMGPQMQRLFLSLFPHVEALNEFGSALHRDASRQVNVLEDVAI